MTTTVHYFAAARAATGVDSEALELPEPTTAAGLFTLLTARHGEALGTVLTRCSLLMDEVIVRDPQTRLRPGARLDVLPPFAGG